MKKNILCTISTKGRYDSTLPLAINSVLNQTLLPDKFILFDDNDDPIDLRTIHQYRMMFHIFEAKGVPWEVIYGRKKGQHHNHQIANKMGYEWVWRLDDDNIAEATTLEKLYAQTGPDVGAVGGSVLMPPANDYSFLPVTGKMKYINYEPNIQWRIQITNTEVEHLHCSFLYRAGIVNYDLRLSKVAHREETLFTWQLKQKGYKVIVTPAVTWHIRNETGGIRDGVKEMFTHDEKIFIETVGFTPVILDNGMGDHIVFKKVLRDIKLPFVFSCYPQIIPGHSIQYAKDIFGNIESWSIYRKMDEWNWTGSLENAFRKLYGVEK